MKIAIESNDGGKTISDPFVRSKGFLIYEVDEKNVFVKEFRTSEKLKTAILEKELNDCCAVISRGMPSAFKQELEKQGKKVLITFTSSPRKALSVFLTDQYTSQIPRLHG
ncbi:MAG: NifB/NifX family molybdenum-iron cluster-binding protein [Ignavibacteriaceae bacterium]